MISRPRSPGFSIRAIEELENPYARKLLADTLDSLKERP